MPHIYSVIPLRPPRPLYHWCLIFTHSFLSDHLDLCYHWCLMPRPLHNWCFIFTQNQSFIPLYHQWPIFHSSSSSVDYQNLYITGALPLNLSIHSVKQSPVANFHSNKSVSTCLAFFHPGKLSFKTRTHPCKNLSQSYTPSSWFSLLPSCTKPITVFHTT